MGLIFLLVFSPPSFFLKNGMGGGGGDGGTNSSLYIYICLHVRFFHTHQDLPYVLRLLTKWGGGKNQVF